MFLYELARLLAGGSFVRFDQSENLSFAVAQRARERVEVALAELAHIPFGADVFDGLLHALAFE